MKPHYLFTCALLAVGISNASAMAGLRIALGNDLSSSSTHLYFSDNATTGFDKAYDKEMHGLPANRMNYIYSVGENGQRLYVNFCPKANTYFSTHLQVTVEETGTFSFLLEGEDASLSGLEFVLTDAASGQSFNIVPGIEQPVSFQFADINTTKDYMLHIFPAPQVISTPVTCYNGKNGSVHASFACNGGWVTTLRTADAVIASTDLCTNDVQFAGLPAGVYFVEGWKNNIKLWEEIIAVGHPPLLAARFTVSPDSLEPEQKVFVKNNSKGSDHWFWDFGDGTTSSQYAPAHTYESPGVYTITLTISDKAGCITTTSLPVLVKDDEMSLSKEELREQKCIKQ